jgi:hypothetical protein
MWTRPLDGQPVAKDRNRTLPHHGWNANREKPISGAAGDERQQRLDRRIVPSRGTWMGQPARLMLASSKFFFGNLAIKDECGLPDDRPMI